MRSDTARTRAVPLRYDLFARARWPYLPYSLALLTEHTKLHERIDAGVRREKAIEHGGEEIRTAGEELLLVERETDRQPATEAAPRVVSHTAHDAFRFQRPHTSDLAERQRIIARV